jgi:hypothetical protein
VAGWLIIPRLLPPSIAGYWQSDSGYWLALLPDKRAQASFHIYGYNQPISFESGPFVGTWSETGKTLNFIAEANAPGWYGGSNPAQFELSSDGQYLHLYLSNSATMLLHRVSKEQAKQWREGRRAEPGY